MPPSLRSAWRSRRGFSAPEVTTNLTPLTITNQAEYSTREPRGFTGWRGSYLQDPITADPWGHHYAVNVAAMRAYHLDAVVLSAGPDGLLESVFEQDGSGDDLIAVVASTGMGR